LSFKHEEEEMMKEVNQVVKEVHKKTGGMLWVF
jgi:hypothetical protein